MNGPINSDAAPQPEWSGRRTSVLIVAPTQELCDGVRWMLAGPAGIDLATLVADWSSGDPMHAAPMRADVLVAVLGANWEDGLQALAATPQRPPTICVGPSNDARVLRRAIQAGMRDYVAAPYGAPELIDAVNRLAHEQAPVAAPPPEQGRLFAVINVKGGSGASFVAANLAHILAVQRRHDVGLLDLDLQFGALPLAFDLEKRSTLLEALNAASGLDPTALRGYASRHDSGVCVLSAMSEQLVLPWEVSRESLARLVTVMRQTFPVVIVDLPRQIDPLTGSILEQADKVLMVMQQSLAHARDAKRMQRVVTTTLGVPRERLMLVVNRHSEKQSVRGRDVQEAVNPSSMCVLPNDFTTVTEALNIGVPVLDYDREAPITRALEDLAGRLGLPPAEVVGARKRGLREALAHALRA